MSVSQPEYAPTVPQLLTGLRERGISLSLVDGKLAVKDDFLLSAEDRKILDNRQADIALFLKAHQATRIPMLAAAGPRPTATQISWWRWIRQSPVPLSHERVPLIRHLPGLAPDKARAALNALLDRHPVLMSHFQERSGTLRTLLNARENFVIEEAQAAAEGDAARQAQAFIAQPLPSDGAWLCKAKIIAGPQATTLAMLFAHLIVDGLSAYFLGRELDMLIAGDTPPESIDYFDYAASEAAWLEGPSGAVLTDYWQAWRARQSALTAPSGKLLPWVPGINVSHSFTIPAAMRDRVQALAARLRASPSSIFLTLYAIALSRWSGRNHFAIRAVGNLRRTAAQMNMVGFMVAIDPVEVRIGAEDFPTLLKMIALEYSQAAMLRLPGFLKFPAQPAHPGIEDVGLGETIAATFNYMPAPRQGGRGGEAPWPPQTQAAGRENWAAQLWPVYLRLADAGEETLGLFQFNEALVTPKEQADLMAAFFAAMEELL